MSQHVAATQIVVAVSLVAAVVVVMVVAVMSDMFKFSRAQYSAVGVPRWIAVIVVLSSGLGLLWYLAIWRPALRSRAASRDASRLSSATELTASPGDTAFEAGSDAARVAQSSALLRGTLQH